MFGPKFQKKNLEAFGKTVADYMNTPGELVLIWNRVNGIPLREEVQSVGIFSNKEAKANKKARRSFDLGVIWGLAYMFLRDEEGKEDKHLYKFIIKGLEYTSNYEFHEQPLMLSREIIKADEASNYGGDNLPFNKGVMFAEVFLQEFYKVKMLDDDINSSDKNSSVENKLKKIKDLFEQGLIDEDIYKTKQKELIDI